MHVQFCACCVSRLATPELAVLAAAICNPKLDPRLPVVVFSTTLAKGENVQQALAKGTVPTLGRRGSPRPGMDTRNEAEQRQSILDVEKNKAAPGIG